jgi:nickel-dependent lactate racemase
MTNQAPVGVFHVPFGRGKRRFSLPPGVTGTETATLPAVYLRDPGGAAHRSILEPVAGPHLRELAAGARSVCIAVTDATRACPDHLLVPPMLSELEAARVPPASVTILVAVGAHRASTDAEKREKLGTAIVDRYKVVDHDATDDANLVPVMDGPGGIPFRINRIAAEADLLLSTGLVEPHQYAGFSGGGKTVAIGCGDEATIAYTHGPAMLDHPGVRLARLDGNPFQDAVRLVSKRANLAFVGNAVLDEEGRIVAVAYGPPEAVQDALAERAAPLFTAPIPAQVDIAVAGVGYPKDANLYQASRAASYLQFAPTPSSGKVAPSSSPRSAQRGPATATASDGSSPRWRWTADPRRSSSGFGVRASDRASNGRTWCRSSSAT